MRSLKNNFRNNGRKTGIVSFQALRSQRFTDVRGWWDTPRDTLWTTLRSTPGTAMGHFFREKVYDLASSPLPTTTYRGGCPCERPENALRTPRVRAVDEISRIWSQRFRTVDSAYRRSSARSDRFPSSDVSLISIYIRRRFRYAI